MKYFYLYVFFLFCLIIIVSYWNTYIKSYQESFNTEKQTFVLLGDSILKNDAYVSDGKSVEKLLIERTNNKTICLAIDHSKIIDVYSQINKIPEDLNSNYTTVFLSIGGNNILSHYFEQGNDTTDATILDIMFAAYKKLVKNINTNFPNVKLVLLDIYYPNNITYNQFHSIIQEWNQMLYKYALNNDFNVLKISNILTQPDDFSFGIEPSAIGSQHLVDVIMATY